MIKTINLTLYDIYYDNGKNDITVMDKKQFAGLKRSGKKKNILTIKKHATITIKIKTN